MWVRMEVSKVTVMKARALYWIAIAIALLSISSTATAQIRIKIKLKKPKITVGSPRITVGTPKVVVGQPKITIKDPFGNIATVLDKAGKDFQTTIRKAGTDTAAEAGRAGKNLEEAAVAIAKYTERQVRGYSQALTDAQKRIREGKVIDALFHAALDPQLNTEENLAKATQESKLVDVAAATAASAYGGPGGAAAYAAWSTYRRTGDADLAFRVGIITGMSNAGFANVQALPTSTFSESVKKAVATGTIGGLAIAASGGDEAAIRKGFLMTGGMVLVQDGYREFTGHELNPEGAKGEPYCMLANPKINASCAPPKSAYVRDQYENIVYENGLPKIDISKLDPERSYVGQWYKPGEKINLASDNSLFMRSVAKVPGMNAMAIFHDQWTYSWDMNILTNVMSIAPAVVLTYMGTVAPINNEIRDTNIESNNKNLQPRIESNNKSQDSNIESYTIRDMFSGHPEFARMSDEVLEEKLENVNLVMCQKGSLLRLIGDDGEGSTVMQSGVDIGSPKITLEDPLFATKKPFDLSQIFITEGWDCYAFVNPDEEP
jgi:hypothetical protein